MTLSGGRAGASPGDAEATGLAEAGGVGRAGGALGAERGG
jgi:hypothetical protein